MKKFLILLSALALFTSCEWFEFDNQEQHNAQVEGKFIDSATGQNVQFGSNPATFQIMQLNYKSPNNGQQYNPVAQSWYVKFNGEYRNKLVWAGDYRLNCLNTNFYEAKDEFKLAKGNNTVDFKVTPYARVINPKFSYNASEKTVTVTFAVSLGKPETINKVTVKLLGYTDRFVCDALNKINDKTATAVIDPEMCDGQTPITLTVSVAADKNQGLFKYDFQKYFRVGVLAQGNGVNTYNRYNFSQTYEAAKGFGAFTLVDNWAE